VKPAAFDYVAPRSLDEAIATLAEHGDEAKVLAGGQSLVPLLNMRLARPGLLIDLNRLPGLDYIRTDNGGLAIGALTRQRAIERSDLARSRAPLMVAATGYIGHPAIRNRGTVGGSLAHGDPVSELPCVAAALDATMIATSKAGDRAISAADFFQSVFTTALQPNEILTSIRIPGAPERTGGGFEELARRHGDFAIIGVAAVLSLETNGAIASARLAYAGGGDRPTRAPRAEAALVGQQPTADTFAAAAQLASEEIDPPSDMHGTAKYRRTIAVTLTKRALATASAGIQK
jgi:carbon-monoxide dehydrogenase medium subunit